MYIVLLLLLPGVRVEDSTTLLASRHFNKLSFEPVKFVDPKKGPILFPNDGPPPTPKPLVVTSRPLIESIAKSDRNPNNRLQVQSLAQSQVSSITFRPNYLQEHTPYEFKLDTVTPNVLVNVPYNIANGHNAGHEEYNQRLVLPIYRTPKQNILQNLKKINTLSPIYRGLSGHNVKPFFNYQAQNAYKSQQQEKEHDVVDESKKDYSSGDNFAFSYTVKDHETGDDFSHSQQSIGSSTNGEYRVRLPDGRMQIVSYTADENGYNANVRYDEENEVNTGVKLDLKALNKYKEEIPNERYLEHRVDEIKHDHSPQYNKFAYSNAKKDNIYFDYVDKTATLKHHADTNDYILTDTNDYLDQVNDKVAHIDKILHEYKGNENHDIKRNHDDYYHDEDTSPIKEYKDYSEEAEGDYSPYKSKYSSFIQNKDVEFKPTVKPTYEELKKYFVSTLFQKPQNDLVSSTVMPSYDSSLRNTQFVSSTLRPYVEPTTERVVTIGSNQPRLFTNIRNLLGPSSIAPDLLNYATSVSPVTATPSSYLYSTIANLKNKISISRRPELSSKYIDKINKYLSFK